MAKLRVISLFLVLIPVTACAVPEYLNYQGRLFDASGNPIQGSHAVSFAVFDATREGTTVWGPFHCDGEAGVGHADRVIVWDGRFNVILGPKDESGRSIFSAFSPQDEKPRFVEVVVDGETISPRQEFLSAPYSVEGYHAEQATYALHGVPPGCVLAYFGAVAPEGWLLCDGSPIPDGSRYDGLRALMGANTPDLRGRVILGLDGGVSRVRQLEANLIGAASGEDYHQLSMAEMPAHDHRYNDTYRHVITENGRDTVHYWDSTAGEANVKRAYPMSIQGGDWPHNNMPPYMTLNWIIKY